MNIAMGLPTMYEGSHYTRGSPWGLLAHGKVDTAGRVAGESTRMQEAHHKVSYHT
jgi:hypothetical protein